MARYVCLYCGYAWLAAKEETRATRQCPRCKTTDLILSDEVESMAANAASMLLPKRALRIDSFRSIFKGKGLLRYRLESTLNLEELIYTMIKGKSLDEAISEVFPEKRARS